MTVPPGNEPDNGGFSGWLPFFQMSSLEVAPAPAQPELSDEQAIAVLCGLLADQQRLRARLAVDALLLYGPAMLEQAVPMLIDLLGHADERARGRAAELLAALGPFAEGAIAALSTVLEDRCDLAQRWAAYALKQAGPAAGSALPALRRLRDSTTDIKTRAVAAVAVRQLDPTAVQATPLRRSADQPPGLIAELTGHRTWAQCVAISPDGRLALSGSGQGGTEADNAVRVWDLDTGKERLCLSGHGDRVTCLAVCPNNSRCLSGSFDETVRVWDLVEGRELCCLRGHTDRVRCVAVSNNGQLALSGGCDNAILLWNLNSGQLVRRFRNQSNWVIGAAFCPDMEHALSGTFDGGTRLFSLHSGRQVAGGRGWFAGLLSRFGRGQRSPLNSELDTVTCVAFDPPRRRAALGCMDKTIRLWDIAASRELVDCRGHTGGVTSVMFSRDGQRVLSGSMDTSVRLWNVTTGEQLYCFEGHRDVVTGVALSADGQLAVSSSADRSVRLWWLPPLNHDP